MLVNDISVERKIEILERTPQIIEGLVSYCYGNRAMYSMLYIGSHKREFYKAKTFYKQFYNDTLTKEEEILFNIFLITGTNEEFSEVLNKYNKKLTSLSKYYNLPIEYILIRYRVYKEIEEYRNTINSLKKQ